MGMAAGNFLSRLMYWFVADFLTSGTLSATLSFARPVLKGHRNENLQEILL